ncbi:hypothetical protein G9P44_004558 [Scheffersomyces stipitis]|nr:hypothetical protein G9P44_004558 [Scheffersomyces stipitis]
MITKDASTQFRSLSDWNNKRKDVRKEAKRQRSRIRKDEFIQLNLQIWRGCGKASSAGRV